MVGKFLGRLSGNAKNAISGNKELLQAVCAMVVRVGSADGKFDDSEEQKGLQAIKSMSIITDNFDARAIETEFDKQADRAKGGRSGRRELLREIQEGAEKGGPDFAKALIIVGLDVADNGGIGKEEEADLRFIAGEIRVDYERVLQEG
jgi:tellurite resistance protein